MAWSNTATLSDSAASNRWRNLFDNHLNGLTGWTVSAHPSGTSSYRSLKFEYTDAHDGSTQAYYWWYNGSSFYEDARYTTTPGDTGTDTTNAISMFSTTSNPWKVWTSDVNSDSLIMTHGKRLIFMWLAPSAIYNPVKSNWDGSTDRSDPQIAPILDRYQFIVNWGTGGTSTTENDCSPDVVQNHGSAEMQSYVDLFYDTFCLQRTAVASPSFFKVSQSDVLVHVPGNGTGNPGYEYLLDSANILVFDGTNYYLRTSPDLSHCGYMFNMGTSEPAF